MKARALAVSLFTSAALVWPAFAPGPALAGGSGTPVRLSALSAPQLRSPANGTAFNASAAITLAWDLPPGSTQYHIQVLPFANDGPAINLIRDAASLYTIDPPVLGQGPYIILPGMTYSWHVRTTDKTSFAGEGDPSWGPWSTDFTFTTPAATAATITPSEPPTGATTPNILPTLRWADANAFIFYYEVQLSKDQTFNTDPASATAAVYMNLVHGGQAMPLNSWGVPASFPLEPGTRYYWRVRPRVQGNGTPPAWSALFFFTTPGGTPTPAPSPTPVPTPTTGGGNILRSLAYREISGFTAGPDAINGAWPVISGDGSRAAYSRSGANPTPSRNLPNRIFIIGAEGGAEKQVDSYTPGCFCGSRVDVSYDGSKVLSTDGRQVRIAGADGGAQSLLNVDNSVENARISGDGSTVVIQLDRDNTIVGTTTRLQRGIYIIGSNGAGLKQIVSPAQIAAFVPGATADTIFPLGTSNPATLSISRDGSRIAFGAGSKVSAYSGRLFTVRSDGSGLTILLSKLDWVTHALVSGNGATVAYQVVPQGSGEAIVGVVGADGAKPLTLATGAFSTGSLYGTDEPWSISHDGTQLFVGSFGQLFRTDGSGVLSMGAHGDGEPTGSRRLFGDTGTIIYRATMNALGTRFLYLSADTNKVLQLVVLDVNPPDPRPVLSVDSANITPAIVRTGPGATLSAKVSGSAGLVSFVVLKQGTPQDNDGRSDDVLHDDGTTGDPTAGDGVYTYNNVRVGSTSTAGSRTVRVHAEGRDSAGRRVGYAIDIEPFTVTE